MSYIQLYKTRICIWEPYSGNVSISATHHLGVETGFRGELNFPQSSLTNWLGKRVSWLLFTQYIKSCAMFSAMTSESCLQNHWPSLTGNAGTPNIVPSLQLTLEYTRTLYKAVVLGYNVFRILIHVDMTFMFMSCFSTYYFPVLHAYCEFVLISVKGLN